MLNLGRLRVLCEVVERGSFSHAAESLSYTQSAVSQAIARLEAEVGTALVVRDRRGVRPTAAGATLVEQAEAIFAQVDAAQAELDAVMGLRGGRLRMASFPSAGATLMPEAIAVFRAGHPDIALTLAEGEPEEVAPRLRAGEFDLALLYEFPGVVEWTGATLRSVTLLEDPMHVALPAAHPLVDRAAVTLQDLSDEDWVQTSASSPCARHVVRSCLAAGFEPRVSFESDDYETVQGLVAAGVGVALIPQLALARSQRLVDDRYLDPATRRDRDRGDIVDRERRESVDRERRDIVVRELSPSSPVRKVIAATIKGPGVSPAAKTMLQVLTDVAERYTAVSDSSAADVPNVPATGAAMG